MSDTEEIECAKCANFITVEMPEQDMINKLIASGYKVLMPETNPDIAKSIHVTSTPFDKVEKKPSAIPKTFKFEQAVLSDQPSASLQNVSHFEFAHVYGNVPKLPFFSGEEPCPKGEVSFKEWLFEVKCLMNDKNLLPSNVLQAVRRSIRGSARQTLISAGENASLDSILLKFNSLFGTTFDKNNVTQEFFNASQHSDESVTAFACRLK
ncbi:hypothetical protein DPMN_152703 [Dreissena polymorpha]|uniref:Paraneoplastic antigen Ma-like C-terminal domain-containing protein n=1 Tax=Dreissena polymorpha TaxID=45954 RepID=A0A9D4J5E6_DREPO|nr:hypothetical protein DPMN_152703 [Dreissena polymorpha]